MAVLNVDTSFHMQLRGSMGRILGIIMELLWHDNFFFKHVGLDLETQLISYVPEQFF